MAGRIAYYGGIVTDGLVLHLDAAKRDSYPGSGTVWRDLSGNGNNGTLINGPTFDRDSGNGSLVFDKVNDKILVSEFLPLLPQNLTFEIWIQGSVTPFGIKFEIGAGGSGTSEEFYARGSNSAVNYIQYFSSFERTDLTIANIYRLTSPAGLPISENVFTQHVVSINEDGSSSSYFNGGIDVKTSPPTGFNRWYINYQDLHLQEVDYISNVKVYNRALSDSEVLQNYNALKSRFGL